jgi:hypothetical protein
MDITCTRYVTVNKAVSVLLCFFHECSLNADANQKLLRTYQLQAIFGQLTEILRVNKLSKYIQLVNNFL